MFLIEIHHHHHHTHVYMLRTRILTKVWSVDYIVLVCWIKTDIAIFINHVIILCSWQSQYCLILCLLMLLVYCTDYSLTRVDFITSVLTVILSSSVITKNLQPIFAPPCTTPWVAKKKKE